MLQTTVSIVLLITIDVLKPILHLRENWWCVTRPFPLHMLTLVVLGFSMMGMYLGILTMLVVAECVFGYDPRCVYDTVDCMLPRSSSQDPFSRASSVESSDSNSTEGGYSCDDDRNPICYDDERYDEGDDPDEEDLVANAENVLVQRRVVPISSD